MLGEDAQRSRNNDKNAADKGPWSVALLVFTTREAKKVAQIRSSLQPLENPPHVLVRLGSAVTI